MTNVGNLIRQKRLELGLTQEELAHKVGYKTKASINKLETTRDVPIKKLKPIADALGVDIRELLGWDDVPEVPNTDMIAFLMKEAPEVFDDSFILEYAKSPKHIQEQIKNYLRFLKDQKTF